LETIAAFFPSVRWSPVLPGELLSLFGERLSSGVIAQTPDQFATSLDGISVAINAIASPLLYVGAQQINFQAPFEIAGSAQAISHLPTLN
jgi:uncharacterized protein (TIGR03437 family)